MFEISEDNLTNALFNNALLGARGSGTKHQARAQARAMLAGPQLLVQLGWLLDWEEGMGGWESPIWRDARELFEKTGGYDALRDIDVG